MVACACGVDNPEGSNYCASCGRPVVDGFQLLEVREPDRSVVVESSVVADLTTRNRWLAVAVVACLAVMVWALWGSGSGGPSAEGGDTTDGETTGEDATTTTEPNTTEPKTATDKASSSTRRTTTTLPELEVLGDGSPLLGEPVGYRLVVGHNTHPPMVLDLDTGALRRTTGPARVDPQMVSGDWLVVRSNGDRLAVVPLDDLGAEPRLVDPSSAEWYTELASRSSRSDGRVWIYEYSGENPSVTLVDLADGAALERLAPFADLTARFVNLSVDEAGLLVSYLGSGVYRSDGDGFTRLVDGWLLASDEQRTLAAACDEQLQCGLRWVDRLTGAPIDLAVPGGRIDEARFLNGTDWLMLFDYGENGPEGRLFDVVTGRELELRDSNDLWQVIPAVSPDGRWLAERIGQAVEVTDLDTGVIHRIEGLDGNSGFLVFVDAAET